MDKIRGFGFLTNNLEENKFLAFVRNHEKTIIDNTKENDPMRDLIEYAKTHTDFNCDLYEFSDMFNEIVCENTGIYHYEAIIANIMFYETGIQFGYYAFDDACLSAVLFEPTFPWELNEAEKKITSRTQISDIIRHYTDELFETPVTITTLSLYFSD